MGKKLKVLIVDDSALVRQSLNEILASDTDIEVMATAQDPYMAAKKMRQEVPDVITLDVEMPRMDGVSFLKKIMAQHPIPVVMCSALTQKGSDVAIKALEAGAVDIIAKPKFTSELLKKESRIAICDAIKAAAQVNLNRSLHYRSLLKKKEAGLSSATTPSKYVQGRAKGKVVVIGASTGGTEALRELVRALPAKAPAMAVVQHMPEHFTRSFAEHLDGLSSVVVKEARNHDTLLPGRLLMAPGSQHMMIKGVGSRYHVEVKDGPLVSRHRPSVDVLFRSAARYAGTQAIGVLLTGMGNDGAQGMLAMKQAGAYTIAEHESSCVVFGMPKEAIKLGGVDEVLPFESIVEFIVKMSESPLSDANPSAENVLTHRNNTAKSLRQ